MIAVISNPIRYNSRYKLFYRFQREMEEAGASLIVVELAFGNRPFEITDSSNSHHVQLRTTSEIWHKENLINLGVKRLTDLHPDWRYMAFIDTDVSFVRSHYFQDRQDFITETVHQLQHYKVVQMFQNAIDLGPTGESISRAEGFAWAYLNGKITGKSECYQQFHPGYAWAITRDAFEATWLPIQSGGLIETGILGSGDRHMAYAWIGKVLGSVHHEISQGYTDVLKAWQERSDGLIQRNIGYVPGTLIHHFHGKKRNRFYRDRWKILTENRFNPLTDLRRDRHGLLELVVMNRRQMKLRDDIRNYFRSRLEDSLDLE